MNTIGVPVPCSTWCSAVMAAVCRVGTSGMVKRDVGFGENGRMLIGEFAAEVGTSARMLRHYEDTGLLDHRQRRDLSRARRSGHGRGGRVRVAADVPLRRLHGRPAGRAGCVPGCAERGVRSGVVGPHPLRWVRARGPADRAR
ncbi:hypothetical protein CGZ98_18125 [Enemella evansiae]|uniref:MerR family DNA-binding transcriptional regulator n=1 Tax=Enemella evansiae TaxID=2016499 RepID=UPI000B979C8C|nr:hypothetical protein CGZ98_18125 [Enemella evansiae]